MPDSAVSKPVEFFQSILDSVDQHIVIIDAAGEILYVNDAWVRFGCSNGCADSSWEGANYLNVCDASAAVGEQDARDVADGTRALISGETSDFYHEYPCHSPAQQRWFMMRAAQLRWGGSPAWILSHQNITERKQAEQLAEELSLRDALTGVANRRRFDTFLSAEWRRAQRTGRPLSLAMVDLDHFKRLNDIYGHQAGDACLQAVGEVLARFAQRPGDLPARYGGEEFALVLADTDLVGAARIAGNLLAEVRALQLPNSGSDVSEHVTASVGVASVVPVKDTPASMLIEAADAALYRAKGAGRDRVVLSDQPQPLARTG